MSGVARRSLLTQRINVLWEVKSQLSLNVYHGRMLTIEPKGRFDLIHCGSGCKF